MSTLPTEITNEYLNEHHSKYLWHPMACPLKNHHSEPLIIARGDGCYVWDIDDNKYLDSMAGLWCVNVGHNHPEMKKAITDQMDVLEYHNLFSTMAHPKAITLAHRIKDMLSEDGMERVFFSSGGSDAVETALKMTRHYWRLKGLPNKQKFISLDGCYHGVQFGGGSLIGSPMSRSAWGQGLPGCYQVEVPNLYRNPWTKDPAELGQICADILERQIINQDPATVAAFIAEPVQGIGGVIVPPENYWPLVRAICDKYDILMIADEVVTGFGRSGAMSGSRGWGVKPDLMVLAKGLTSGYIPMGATAANGRVAEAFDSAPPPEGLFLHGYTYSGHPLACAAAHASLDIVERENLSENAREVGAYLLDKLQVLTRYSHVGDVRGKGLMACIEMVEDKETKQELSPMSTFGLDIGAAAGRNGALVRAVQSLIILSPPLTFTKQHADDLVQALEAAFDELDTLA